MIHDLQRLEHWADALLMKLQPAQRRQVIRQVAVELQCAHAQLIAWQIAPDGTPFVPCKQRKTFRDKKGRIRRQQAAMFNKLRTDRFLKAQSDAQQASVGFFDMRARLARVHQEGSPVRVPHDGPIYKYPARALVGFSASDKEYLRYTIVSLLI